ncbi:ALG3-domain-containing protein [Rhizoclosmatium globosum]|uniref:Dol-P-Man:Man(5)GlcNAc(2)-PP-Dol alpha-1,3-mannosyltransferase n=1 Tax=Rhizoclosmatium globosum TaxID=329046 RepID=A0A1Y2BZK3_9FUNG|nr:ALG3-domain-containing protein [Rhizoclosmatium globosum]|eukprot:ORY40156.1 ALG3-domain-containing protein [Rhizoclosmatium globosum]
MILLTTLVDRFKPSPSLLFWSLLIAEKAFCLIVLYKIAYTEIDWVAYMQQTTQFMNGERDYTKMKGDTGPLVYPAGFLYIFSFLNWITNGGSNIVLAQWIYADFAVLTLYIVLTLYFLSTKVPWYATPLLLLSKRIHSIFILRLFNDPIAMLPLYFSIYALSKGNPLLSSILFSIALSIKMNILLFAPAFALLMYQSVGLLASIRNAAVVLGVQVALAAPFITAGYGVEYVTKAFEFSRQFFYVWTVNWRFVGEDLFLSKGFAMALVVGHLSVLVLFLGKWTGAHGGILSVIKKGLNVSGTQALNIDYILLTMFTSNLIGITFARSLHYQFYSWYFYTIPYLLFRTQIPLVLKIAIFGTIEYCWNVYPSTNQSSVLLLSCHIILLVALFVAPVESNRVKFESKKSKTKAKRT